MADSHPRLLAIQQAHFVGFFQCLVVVVVMVVVVVANMTTDAFSHPESNVRALALANDALISTMKPENLDRRSPTAATTLSLSFILSRNNKTCHL